MSATTRHIVKVFWRPVYFSQYAFKIVIEITAIEKRRLVCLSIKTWDNSYSLFLFLLVPEPLSGKNGYENKKILLLASGTIVYRFAAVLAIASNTSYQQKGWKQNVHGGHRFSWQNTALFFPSSRIYTMPHVY